MTSRPRLQARPPFQLAIDKLPQLEQSHVQIAIRVISPRLAVPCHLATNNHHADFTLQPAEQSPGLILSSPSRQISLERPLRIAPFADALSTLMDESGIHSALPPSTPSPNAHNKPLLATLLERKHPGAFKITLDNDLVLLIDDRHFCAYSALPLTELLEQLGQPHATNTEPLTKQEFSRLSSGTHAIQLEQLCWATIVENNDISTQFERWHKDPDALIQLHTWPNLSRQPDATAWLSVLARLSRHRARLSALMEITRSVGIDSDRARHGLSMLLAFRHARIVEPSTSPPLMTQSPTTSPRAKNSKGLLNRLRAQLRAITK